MTVPSRGLAAPHPGSERPPGPPPPCPRTPASGSGSRSGALCIALALAVVAGSLATPHWAAGQANPNPGFEERDTSNPSLPLGWSPAGALSGIALDSLESRSGRYSLRLRRSGGDDIAAMGRSIPAEALRGTRVTLSGHIRTNGIFPGYAGLLLRFEGGGRILFADDLAGRGATGTSGWAPFHASARVPEAAEIITFGAILPGEGTAWFDDLALETAVPVDIPPAPAAPSRQVELSAEDDPVAYVQHAIDLMRERSLVRDSVDWDALSAAHVGSLGPTDGADAAYRAIRNALRDLGDGHSQFLTPESVSAREDPAGPSSGPTSPLTHQRLDGGVGYLGVPGFIGTSEEGVDAFATEIDRGISRLAAGGVCGWIVDLRSNPGGNVWPMLAGLSSLLGGGEVGAFRRPDGTRFPWVVRGGEVMDGARVAARLEAPAAPDLAGAPVAVLTGPGTASSGEAVVVAFRGRPGTRSFGQETAGLSTSNTSLRLGDGAVIELTSAAFEDRTGTGYGGVIRPDEVVLPASRPGPLARDPVIRRASDWLGSTESCS